MEREGGMSGHTPGPWHVRDMRASEMRRLGWKGPSIDRILITNKTGPEILRDEGEDCVVARIQFDHRPEELREGNIADARLIAAAPEMLDVLQRLCAKNASGQIIAKSWGDAERIIAKATGTQSATIIDFPTEPDQQIGGGGL